MIISNWLVSSIPYLGTKHYKLITSKSWRISFGRVKHRQLSPPISSAANEVKDFFVGNSTTNPTNPYG
jgi:ABC-type taurine transport system substrate-binding protein